MKVSLSPLLGSPFIGDPDEAALEEVVELPAEVFNWSGLSFGADLSVDDSAAAEDDSATAEDDSATAEDDSATAEDDSAAAADDWDDSDSDTVDDARDTDGVVDETWARLDGDAKVVVEDIARLNKYNNFGSMPIIGN